MINGDATGSPGTDGPLDVLYAAARRSKALLITINARDMVHFEICTVRSLRVCKGVNKFLVRISGVHLQSPMLIMNNDRAQYQ